MHFIWLLWEVYFTYLWFEEKTLADFCCCLFKFSGRVFTEHVKLFCSESCFGCEWSQSPHLTILFRWRVNNTICQSTWRHILFYISRWIQMRNEWFWNRHLRDSSLVQIDNIALHSLQEDFIVELNDASWLSLSNFLWFHFDFCVDWLENCFCCSSEFMHQVLIFSNNDVEFHVLCFRGLDFTYSIYHTKKELVKMSVIKKWSFSWKTYLDYDPELFLYLLFKF